MNLFIIYQQYTYYNHNKDKNKQLLIRLSNLHKFSRKWLLPSCPARTTAPSLTRVRR